MKSYEEIAQNVFKRGHEYFRRKERRIAAVKKGVPIMSIFFIFALAGVSLMDARSVGDTEPVVPQQIEIIETQDVTETHTAIESSATASDNTDYSIISTDEPEVTSSAITFTTDFMSAPVTVSTADDLPIQSTVHNVIVKETLENTKTPVSTAVSKTAVVTETINVSSDETDIVSRSDLEFDYKIKSDGTAQIIKPVNEADKYDHFTKLVIPSEIDGRKVTGIGADAFANLKNLTDVYLPGSVTSIGAAAFSGNASLEKIRIMNPDCDIYDSADTIFTDTNIYCYYGSTAELYAIKYGRNYVSLGENTLPTGSGECGENLTWTYAEGVLTISGSGDMYDYSESSPAPWSDFFVTDIILDNDITRIGNSAFSGCEAVTSVTIPDNVTSIGDYAFSAMNIKEVTIPYGVTNIGSSAFRYCYSLKSVTIPDSVTSIGSLAFFYCTNLEKVTIPYGVTKIGYGTFSQCHKLASVSIPDSITVIEDRAFANCQELKEVDIPKNVTSIGERAFESYYFQESITINNPVCTIYDDEETIDRSAVIIGYTGSTAEKYALKYNRTFVSLGEMPVIIGDVNGDGILNLSDASDVLRIYAESAVSAESSELILQDASVNADVNGDGKVDISDATLILEIYSKTASGMN